MHITIWCSQHDTLWAILASNPILIQLEQFHQRCTVLAANKDVDSFLGTMPV